MIISSLTSMYNVISNLTLKFNFMYSESAITKIKSKDFCLFFSSTKRSKKKVGINEIHRGFNKSIIKGFVSIHNICLSNTFIFLL